MGARNLHALRQKQKRGSVVRGVSQRSGYSVAYAEELVKGSFRKKVKALFDFYDIDRSGSISHAELLKMVGSS